MSDLLHTVAALRRERDCPEIWRQVVEGVVLPQDAVRAQEGREPPARLAASAILFAPPTPQQRDARIAAWVAEAAGARVVSIASPRTSRRRWLLPVAAVAAAALVLIIVVPDRDPERSSPVSVVELGVEYDLELTGGFAAVRSGEVARQGAPVVLQSASAFELLVRPEVSLPPERTADLAVFAFSGKEARSIAVQAERVEGGALAIAGRVGGLLQLPPGEWTLTVVVGPHGHLPTDPSQVAPGTTPAPHWQVLRQAIRILP